MPAVTLVECARHPGVETGLRCSRCETPICPKCLVQTPVGARCKDCARTVKSPVYTLKAPQLLYAALASVGGGVAMGLVWAFVLRPFTNGFLSIFLGMGLAYVFTRLLEFATRRKRGPVVVGFAIAGIVIAWSFQILFFGLGFALGGLVAVGFGTYVAYQNLR